MSFLGRLGKGLAASMLTNSFSGGVAAALTDNFGIGLGTGMASRMMMNNYPMGGMYGSMGDAWGGNMGWGMGNMGMGSGMSNYGGYGGMNMGYSNMMYDMAYNNNFDTMANSIAWY